MYTLSRTGGRRIAIGMADQPATPALARVHSGKFLSRFSGAGHRVTALPVPRRPQHATRHARLGTLHRDRTALHRGQRAPRAQPVAQCGPGARIAVLARRPQVRQVVRAAQDHGDNVVDGRGVGTAPPAHPAVPRERGRAQAPPAGRPLPRTAHVLSVAGGSRIAATGPRHARPGRHFSTGQNQGGNVVCGNRQAGRGEPVPAAKRDSPSPSVAGEFLARAGVVRRLVRRMAIRGRMVT